MVVKDNGPQYDNGEMKAFAEKYGSHHVTSSPHHSKSNGLAERAVKTVTKAHLIHLPCHPMNRKLRTDIPVAEAVYS